MPEAMEAHSTDVESCISWMSYGHFAKTICRKPDSLAYYDISFPVQIFSDLCLVYCRS